MQQIGVGASLLKLLVVRHAQGCGLAPGPLLFIGSGAVETWHQLSSPWHLLQAPCPQLEHGQKLVNKHKVSVTVWLQKEKRWFFHWIRVCELSCFQEFRCLLINETLLI
jgi:hypothetical protein